MMEAICHAVRQAFYKCVLRREQVKQILRIAVIGHKSRHLGGELVGKTHHRQKLALLLRQRIYHGGNKHGVYVRIAVGQRASLGERAQIEVHGGKPPLAGIQQAFDLLIGKLRSAAMCVNGKLRVV